MSNMTDLWLSGAIFSTSKYSKTPFRPGRGPRWDPLDAFVSISAPRLSGAPQHKFLATPMVSTLISLVQDLSLSLERPGFKVLV